MDALSWLNALPREQARDEFLRCCGCALWAEVMSASRPFEDLGQVAQVGEAAWNDLSREGWLEAFAAHPRIGDKDALKQKWASGEQSGAVGADDAVLDALAAGNKAYEEKFGHIFIVCATGKTAKEMVDLLTVRLENIPAHELRIAAAEQAKIMKLRLEKMFKEHDNG